MEKEVYLLIEHSVDNFDKDYQSVKVCATKNIAKWLQAKDERLSTEIVSSEIEEACFYDSIGEKKYYTEVGGIEVYLYKDNILSICHPGPNDDDVNDAISYADVSEQFDNIPIEKLREAVNEVVADKNGCKSWSKSRLVSYIVWLAAWDLLDDENSEWNQDHEK